MQAYDYDAVVYDGEIYCTECLSPDIDEDDVSPIFAGQEWDYPPVCNVCGTEHTYVELPDSYYAKEKARELLDDARMYREHVEQTLSADGIFGCQKIRKDFAIYEDLLLEFIEEVKASNLQTDFADEINAERKAYRKAEQQYRKLCLPRSAGFNPVI